MKMALAYAEPVVVLAHRFAIGAGVFAVYRAFTGQSLRVKWAEIFRDPASGYFLSSFVFFSFKALVFYASHRLRRA